MQRDLNRLQTIHAKKIKILLPKSHFNDRKSGQNRREKRKTELQIEKKNSNRPEYRNLPNFERFLSFARYRREGGSMT
jgi:hypothetical protein